MPKPVPTAKLGKNVEMREVCVELGKLNPSSGTQERLSTTKQDQPSTTGWTRLQRLLAPLFCSSGQEPLSDSPKFQVL